MQTFIQSAIINSQRIPRGGLVAWYWFDSGSFNDVVGNSIKDHSGYNNAALAVNSPGYVPGQYGMAISMSKTANHMVTASHSTSLNLTGSFTVACWCKIGSTAGASKYPNIVGKATDFTGYALYYNSTSGLYGQIGNAGAWYNTGLYNIPLNAWKHVAITYDGSLFRMYVDGTINNSASVINKYPATNAAGLIIGRHYSSAVYGYMDMYLDDVRIYNRCLTDAEMSSFMP